MTYRTSQDTLSVIESQEFLPPVSRWVTFGSWFIVLALGSAIAASFSVKYRTTVKASAIIRPVGEPRLIQSVAAGPVVDIAVTNNTAVAQGDVIAKLDTSRMEARAVQLVANLQQAKNRLSQTQNQLIAADQQIAAEAAQAERAIAAAAADFTQAQRNTANQSVEAQAGVQEVQAQIDLATNEVNSFRPLVASGAVARLQLAEKEAALATAQARLNSLQASLNPSSGNVQAARERISQTRAQGAATLARLQQSKQQLMQQGLEIQEQIQIAEQEIAQVELDLKNAVVRSPISGILHELNLRNTGQIINPGETIAKVIPADTLIEIKALVPAGQINKVTVGLPAQMRVSACPFSEFGTVTGQVKAISPDTITQGPPSANGGSASAPGGAFYSVTVATNMPALESSANQNECTLQPGTEGRVTIISQEETVMTFLRRKVGLLTNF